MRGRRHGDLPRSVAEIRRSGNNVTAVLAQSGTMVSRGMRLGPGVCVFVDGQPRPGFPVNAYRPEDIKAIGVLVIWLR